LGHDQSRRDSQTAAELVALAPDVILSTGDTTVPPLLEVTRTVPIVVPGRQLGAGYVESLARPGGNVTGFMLCEQSIGVKWLELLKEIAPNVTRVAVIRDSYNPAQTAQFGVIQAVAPMLKVEVTSVGMHDASEIEQAVETFARSPNGGQIVVGSAASIRYRDLVITLAARNKLPSIYWERFFVVAGGLISYVHTIDQYGICGLFSSQEKTATTKPSAGSRLLRSSSEPDRCCMYSRSFFAALGLCTRHKKMPPLHPAGMCQWCPHRPLPVRVS
jgi:ABC-type uncharacterized transport system substrate-binding protein